jgi:Icc-related predicted phosphoesterase
VHEYTEVEGLRIFGSPHVLADYQMGFTYKHEEADKIWASLPEKLDILITHQPPFGILDAICKPIFPGPSVGCKRLLEAVHKIEPKLHIFGHIHESHGHVTSGKTDFYNVAFLDNIYQPKNKPIIIEL